MGQNINTCKEASGIENDAHKLIEGQDEYRTIMWPWGKWCRIASEKSIWRKRIT